MPTMEKFLKKINKADVVSFDIFDTLLLRSFLEPKDVFYQLEALNNKPGFAESRIQAERVAWEKLVNKDKDDVTLDEIYSYLPADYLSLKDQELQMEYDNLFANPEIKELFDFAVKNNKQVIITSDMYLPHSFLYKVISDKLGTDKFKLFVSCEYGKRKHTGNLFKHILSELKVSPDKVCHIGDNKVSDYNVPRSLGIEAFLYTKPSDRFLADRKIYNFYKSHNSLMGRNFIGTLSLAYEYFKNNKKLSYWQKIGFLYGGVLAHTYVQEILKWCTKHNLSDVAFVARDGYTLKQIFDILNIDKQVKSHYVYAPRFTNTLAYLDFGNQSVLSERKNVLLKFLSENGIKVLPGDGIDKYTEQLKLFSDIEREEYKQYIENHKFGNRVGVVDSISGAYSAQKLISKTVENSSIVGLYWWTISSHEKSTLPKEQFYTGSYIPCFCHLIEFFFAAPEKPIHRILHGEPVYKESIDKYEQIKIDLYPEISEAMVEFSKILVKLKLDLNVSDELVFDWINSFVINANKTDFKQFKNIKNGVDQSHTKYDPVLPKIACQQGQTHKIFREIRHLIFRKKKTDDSTKIYILGIKIITLKRRSR